jgi:hypothetical protein
MDRLTDLVRRKLARHGESEVALATLATHPYDRASIQALAAVLSAIAADDETFQIELAELVDQAKQDPTIGAFATHVEGLANIGQIVNLAEVRDVHFHLPGSATFTPSPAPIRHTWTGAAHDSAPPATNTQGERRPQSEPPTGDLPTVEEDLRALNQEALHRSDPALRARLYEELGIDGLYDPNSHTVRVQVELGRRIGRVGGGT